MDNTFAVQELGSHSPGFMFWCQTIAFIPYQETLSHRFQKT